MLSGTRLRQTAAEPLPGRRQQVASRFVLLDSDHATNCEICRIDRQRVLDNGRNCRTLCPSTRIRMTDGPDMPVTISIL